LVPAKLTTLDHLSVSAAMNAAKSLGEPPPGPTPNSASRFLISGSCSASLISLLRKSTISGGVFFGAAMLPDQRLNQWTVDKD